eukprot:COSAG01_NODE_45848_length_405_cov_3.428105_1_plen_82_part_10
MTADARESPQGLTQRRQPKQYSRFPTLLAGARPRSAPILARAAHTFHPLTQEPGYSGKTSLLTPAGPLPERVAARSGANTCG